MCVRPGFLHQSSVLGIVLGAMLALSACATAPPVQEMSDARQAIAAAVDADAEQLAPRPLADARRFVNQAERQIREESYGQARASAVRAKNRALRALRDAQSALDAAVD